MVQRYASVNLTCVGQGGDAAGGAWLGFTQPAAGPEFAVALSGGRHQAANERGGQSRSLHGLHAGT